MDPGGGERSPVRHEASINASNDVDVVLVLGIEVAPGGDQPNPKLCGRLDTAAQLVRDGHAKVILVSGDASGS